VDLKLKKGIDHLQFPKMVVRRDGRVADEQYVKGLKEFALRTIKRFSHIRDREKLRRYMDDHFLTGDAFALGISMSTLELTSLEMNEFSKIRHENLQNFHNFPWHDNDRISDGTHENLDKSEHIFRHRPAFHRLNL
jgi:hypothetical protein